MSNYYNNQNQFAGGGYNSNYAPIDSSTPTYYPPPPPPPPQQQQYQQQQPYQQEQQHQQQYQQQYQPPPPSSPAYYPPPNNPPPPTNNYANADGGDFKGAARYNPTPKYRDLWAAIVFLLQFSLFVAMAVLFIKSLPSDAFKHRGQLSYSKSFYSWPTMVMWLCVLVVSLAFSLVYLLLMQMFAGNLIVVSFWFSVVVTIGTGVYYLIAKIWFAGAIMVIFGLFYAFMWFSWRKRIPFSKLVLETVCHVSRRFPSTIVTSVVFLFIQALYTALWSLAFVGSFKYMDKYKSCSMHTDRNGRQYQSCSNTKQILSWVFMVFSFYWTTGVIINVLHTTLCGIYATFYFFEGAPGGYPTRTPALSSLKRATTNSFGSVCFGSLIIAVIQTMRAILRALRDNGDDNIATQILACCIDCILGCIQGMVEFINKYAYVEVALYGKPYLEAARDTWDLIKDRGVETLINDCLIGNVIQLGSFLCGAVVAIVAWLYITITKPQYNVTGSYTAPIIIAAFIMAMSMFKVLMKCIESGTATTFVCLAEDPQVMARNNPRLFAMLQESYPQVVQGVRGNHAYGGV